MTLRLIHRLALGLTLLAVLAALGLAAGCQDGTGGGGTTPTGRYLAKRFSGAMDDLDQALAQASGKEQGEAKEAGDQELKPGEPAQAVVIVPISATAKREFAENTGQAWTPLVELAKSGQALASPARVEVAERTELYAVFIDYARQYEGKHVVFTWCSGADQRAYCQPMAARVVKHPDFKWPVAWSYAWSSPAMGGRLLRGLGLRSITDYRTWANSQCFGPRVVQVHPLAEMKVDGEGRPSPIPAEGLLAEASTNVCEPGVKVVQ